jgi:hypothetical protein
MVTYESLCQEREGVFRGVDEVRKEGAPAMPQNATINSLPVAFEMIMVLGVEVVEWGEDCRASVRNALAALLEGRMIDEHLERMAGLARADRRMAATPRWLLTGLACSSLT